jgi:histone-lysine N-methyltransferase SETMAR
LYGRSDMDSKLEKIKHRAVIQFLTKEGNTRTNIYDRMHAVYGDDAPSLATVKRWVNEFQHGRESLEDDPHTGRPVDVTTEEMCRKVEDFIMMNRRVTVIEIANEMMISVGSVEKIIHDKLGMSKVCARWVPRMLTTEMKQNRVECSREVLTCMQADFDDFYSRLVTGDETWIHHWDPESKQESMQWKHHGSPPPRKFKVQASAGKIMASVFWDSQGLIMIDYMPHKTTINGQYYAELLVKLREAIKEKRRGKLRRGVRILHDNAPVHTAKVAKAALEKCGFELIPHPPYSPDLAPSDFFLFQHLKKHLRGTRFNDDEELKSATEAWFEDQPKDFYNAGIRKLQERCDKCISIGGDYVEK